MAEAKGKFPEYFTNALNRFSKCHHRTDIFRFNYFSLYLTIIILFHKNILSTRFLASDGY